MRCESVRGEGMRGEGGMVGGGGGSRVEGGDKR